MSKFIEAFFNTFDRAFGRGCLPNIWFVDFMGYNQNIGFAGIPKLASLIGETGRNIMNEVSLVYDPHSLETGTATATFFVQMYAFFGNFGLLFSILILFLLDYIVLFFEKYPAELLICLITGLFVSALNLCYSQWTTVLFSKGIIFSLIVIVLLKKFTWSRSSASF